MIKYIVFFILIFIIICILLLALFFLFIYLMVYYLLQINNNFIDYDNNTKEILDKYGDYNGREFYAMEDGFDQIICLLGLILINCVLRICIKNT